MVTIFQWIDSTESSAHIAFLMCAFSKDSEYGKSVGKTADFPHNVFRWNLTPLTEGSKGTIEFRQPPGSANASDSQLWIQFAASFLQGAIHYADRLDAGTPATLDLLKSFVLNGASISGVQDLTLLENLFVGKSQLGPGAYDLKAITTPDLERMQQKALEANITLAKFKKLFGYK